MSTVRTAKELVRHFIKVSGLWRFHLRWRKARGQNVDHLYESTLPGRFAAVYRNRVWLNDRATGSLSGLGSEVEHTRAIRSRLPDLFSALRCEVLLDLGCGDFSWMKQTALPCKYVGVDIVEDVIASNVRDYGSESRRFVVLDATREALPLADVVLCREVLFHLSFGDAWRVLDNVRSSGARFLVATSDDNLKYNADIESGDFRLLNLRRRPFGFPAPRETVPDDSCAPGRVLGVWDVAVMPRRPRSARE
jgi:SAM-dependent methyltransferase